MTCTCTCKRKFKGMNALKNHIKDTGHAAPRWMIHDGDPRLTAGECDICKASPIHPLTGMCVRCSTGGPKP